MKFPAQTILVAFSLTLILSGCAALNLKEMGFGDLGFDDSSEAEMDPVAAAAARFTRSPASDGAWDSVASSAAHPSGRSIAPRSEHLAMGMGMSDVVAIWGEPSDVETAGDPRDGNQRWTYFSGLSSRWGMGGRRVVYFESGRVAGWRNRQ